MSDPADAPCTPPAPEPAPCLTARGNPEPSSPRAWGRLARAASLAVLGIAVALAVAGRAAASGAAASAAEKASGPAGAADTVACEDLPGEIYQARLNVGDEAGGKKAKEEARRVVRLSKAARRCIGRGSLDANGGRLTAWLYDAEVFALNWLEDTRTAAERVEAFLSAPDLRAAADSNRMGRMLYWKAHLHAERGQILDGVLAYQKTRPYADHLARDTRQDLTLNGAYFYWRTGKHEKAMTASRQVEDSIRAAASEGGGVDSLSDALRFNLFRSLRHQALVHLENGRPGRAIRHVQSALSLMPSRRSDVARITLARAQADLGRLRSAQKTFQKVRDSIVQRDPDRRLRLLLRFRRGQFRLRANRPRAALKDLKEAQAIADSSGAREFEAQVLLALGKAHRAVDAQGRALAVFEETGRLEVDRGNQAAVEARRKAQMAALSIQDSAWLSDRVPGWAFPLIGLLLAVGLGGGLALQACEWSFFSTEPREWNDETGGNAKKSGRRDADAKVLPGGLHSLHPSGPSSEAGESDPAEDEGAPGDLPLTSDPSSGGDTQGRDSRGGDSRGTPPRYGDGATSNRSVRDGSTGDGSVGDRSVGDGTTGSEGEGRSDRLRLPTEGFDERGERLLRLCEHYVQLWKSPPKGLPQGRRDELLQKVPHLIFQATLEWLYGRDVWRWLQRDA